MTRVLVVTPIYPVPDDPLVGIFVERQVAQLAQRGLDCRVLVYRPAPPPFPRWLVHRSWVQQRWRRLKRPRAPGGVPASEVFYERRWTRGEDVVPAIAESLVRFLDTHPEYHEADVVYGQWLWTGGAAALALRTRFGWPVVAIARGSEMHEWHSVHPQCRPYVTRVIAEADRVLSNCEDLRVRADQLVPGSAERIEVVYNGCDTDVFRPDPNRDVARRALGLDRDGRLLLCCADIIARKGIDILADAWRLFGARHRDWQLLLVGRPVDRALVQAVRRAGHGRVRIAGLVPPDRLLRYLQAADAYVQPSRLEGLANATMEAMAVGLPVVSSDACGQRELIRHGANGWLVAPGDPEALAAALDEMASDPEMARHLGIGARRTIQTAFHPGEQAARLARLLQRTAAKVSESCTS